MRSCQHLVVEQNILVLLGTSFLINSQQDLILGGLTKLNTIHQFTHPLLPPIDFFFFLNQSSLWTYIRSRLKTTLGGVLHIQELEKFKV